MKRAGIVKTKVADGRYELGYEVGYLSAAAFNATGTPIVGITVNNDADFLVQRIHVMEFGAAPSFIILPSTYTMQVRDSATGNVFYRTPANPYHLAQMPFFPGYAPTAGGFQPVGRFAMNDKGLPAPYLMRRASSSYIEFSKAAGAPAITGDMLVVYEGFRIYPGQKDPVPLTIEGYNTCYSWGGQVAVPNGLPGGLQLLASATLAGPGQGKYVLKDFTLASTGIPATVNGFRPPADAILGIQVQDTRTEQKLWARMPNGPAIGQYMPASVLTGGGTGFPWVWPRYIEGQDQMVVNIFGDPSAWAGGNPGTIDLSFNGVCIYG